MVLMGSGVVGSDGDGMVIGMHIGLLSSPRYTEQSPEMVIGTPLIVIVGLVCTHCCNHESAVHTLKANYSSQEGDLPSTVVVTAHEPHSSNVLVREATAADYLKFSSYVFSNIICLV